MDVDCFLYTTERVLQKNTRMTRKEEGTKDKKNSAPDFKPFLAKQVSTAHNSKGMKNMLKMLLRPFWECTTELQGERQARDTLHLTGNRPTGFVKGHPLPKDGQIKNMRRSFPHSWQKQIGILLFYFLERIIKLSLLSHTCHLTSRY